MTLHPPTWFQIQRSAQWYQWYLFWGTCLLRFYQWSNDNYVYTELAHPGLHEVNDALLVFFATESPPLDNSLVGKVMNVPRNVARIQNGGRRIYDFATVCRCIDIIEGSLEAKLPTIWRDENAVQLRRSSEMEKVRREKVQVREKVGKSRNTGFFQCFVAPEGRKVGSLKRRVRRHLGR